MSTNTYVLINDENRVVNIVAMPKEPVDFELLQPIMRQNGAATALKIITDESRSNIVDNITLKGTLAIGATLLDNGTFLEDRPSEQHILDPTNSYWTLPFSMQEFEEVNDENLTVLDHESNYWE
jgi:hypothetical protein